MYRNKYCIKHPNTKLAEDMLGRKWCPKCVAQEMANKVSKELKLNLKRI